MSEWQPIEMAPKDGTKIVLHFPGPWRDPSEIGASVGQWTGSYWWCTAIWASSEMRGAPTHWMPLPEPPEAA